MNEFETAMVNEPSVFEPLKFYCRYITRFSTIFTREWDGGGATFMAL